MAKFPTWIAVVAGAMQDREDRFLLQRRPAGKHHAGLWEFPGGKLEPGENPREALARELAEELSITVAEAALSPLAFAENSGTADAPGIVILLYKVCDWEGKPVPEDGAQIGWFGNDDMDALAMPPLDIDLLRSLRGEAE